MGDDVLSGKEERLPETKEEIVGFFVKIMSQIGSDIDENGMVLKQINLELKRINDKLEGIRVL
ncbi:MAG: hypothetical protein GTN70_09915 [Deltaproteobacteria bacterium]|nr:hypothetical protein [Deltaproteobacteria bacterium]